MKTTIRMYKYFTIAFLLLSLGSFGQKMIKYDSTMKIGKVGYRVTCINRSIERNVLNVRPIGFKSEAREVNLELRGRVLAAEIDDLNQDGFPDIIIYVVDATGKTNLFTLSSKENETLQPIYFPDITNDMQLSKGYRGFDDFKLVEGILFRKFPIYEADTAIKVPTKKVRQIMYRVVTGEHGMLNFKAFKNFDLTTD
jgi:hypothetical protein